MNTLYRTSYREVASFITKDGSAIRELMHPSRHAVRAQSLAEARVAPGARTLLHRHRVSEEVYFILAGTGVMTLGAEKFDVEEGDSIVIVPGTPHCVENTGDGELVILCMCAPAYSHEDTDLLSVK